MADVKFSDFDVGGEMQVGDIPVGLRTGQPTKNFQFDFPGAGIKDSSGNYLFEYATAGALAVNHLKLVSALTTNAALLTADGSDTNIDIAITPKGIGALVLDGLRWPTSDGAPNTFLFTDGSGQLAFTSASVTTAIIGTANQVLANGTSGVMETGNVTLTTPQDIAVTSIPTFAGLNLNGATSGTLSLLATAITGTNTITFPAATGTVALTSQLPTPSALTRVDDTNVTLTLGGSPTVALLAATSLTLGWTGQLSLTRGGTNASLVASNGGIVYSTASALAILSSTASAALVTNSSGIPVFTSSMTDGQIVIGSTGATPTAATLTAGTNITITNAAGSITINATGAGVVPAALTKVDDTNVTLTLGGTPATSLLQATSLTLGWTGQLGLTRGGTNASLVASNGGIVYSNASAFAILAGTATANQVLLSGSSSAPTWSTATYPATTTINQLLYSSSANTITGLATANSASLVTTSAGVPVFSSSMTNGQIIIGSTGATPTAATLTAGANISIVNAAGSITISATGLAGFSWTVVSGTSQAMLSNNGYIANNAGLVTLTLPATSAVGDEIDIIGKGAGGWLVQCGGGQTVVVGSSTTTSGGSVASTNAKDSFYMICTVANTEWTVGSAPQSGGLTIA